MHYGLFFFIYKIKPLLTSRYIYFYKASLHLTMYIYFFKPLFTSRWRRKPLPRFRQLHNAVGLLRTNRSEQAQPLAIFQLQSILLQLILQNSSSYWVRISFVSKINSFVNKFSLWNQHILATAWGVWTCWLDKEQDKPIWNSRNTFVW